MKLRRFAAFAAMLIAISCAITARAEKTPAIIPLPAHAVSGNGSLDVSRGLWFNASAADADARSVELQLAKLLQQTRGPKITSAHAGGLPQLIFQRRASQVSGDNAVDESYRLEIEPHRVRITASNRAGFFYGAISFWQLASHTDGSIPGWVIEDAPHFRWRGLMLDSARHMQSEAFLYQLLDYMAEHKLNVLQWHLTDDQGWRLEIKHYPRLTSVGAYRPQTMPSYTTGSSAPAGPYGGYYTQAQVRRIVAYAQARNITIVPEIEMPGHATAALVAYPNLRSSDGSPRAMPVGWGIYPNLYNPSPETFTFLRNVLSEVMDLFPSTYIHLGGDEAVKDQWKQNPAIQKQMQALGLANEDALQGWFMAQMEKFLNEHGRRIIGWDEILEGDVSKTATIMSWRGMQGGISAAKLGHDAVLTPSRPLYFNYRQSDSANEPPGRDPVNSLEAVYDFQATPSQLTPEEQTHILGVQGSTWTEYLLTEDVLQHMIIPRAAALAELAWTPDSQRNFKSFLSRLQADNQRAVDVGLHPASSVFEVHTAVGPSDDGLSVKVALSTQSTLGEIHYSLDGSKVTPHSPLYTDALTVRFPTPMHAQAFDGDTALGEPMAQNLTLAFTLRRDSRVLDSCNGSAGIQIEQDPPRGGKRPVFRVVFSNPCWIYRGAAMSQFNSLTLSVGSIPYIFHTPGHAIPGPSIATTTAARIAIHMDSCNGTLLANVPLEAAYRKYGEIELPLVAFTQQQGIHDLCFQVEDADPATVWLLHTIQPIPRQRK